MHVIDGGDLHLLKNKNKVQNECDCRSSRKTLFFSQCQCTENTSALTMSFMELPQ